MKRTLTTGALLLGAALLLIPAGTCRAGKLFHSGGIGECNGCHGGGYQSTANGANRYNLLGSDASSTCLLCHQAAEGAMADQHHVATATTQLQGGQPPLQLTPGGDFGWTRKNFSWQGEGGRTQESPGELHGHSIVALDFGYDASRRMTVAPGGSYSSSELSCTSCHDPHGNYRRNADGSITSTGNRIVASGSYPSSPNPSADTSVGSYRLLAGKGYRRAGTDFQTDPPAAVSPESYNRGEAQSDTRVAYGSGMSEWCQNCHPRIHSVGARQHVTGNDAKLTMEVTANYNNYLRSGDLNGSSATSYSSLVPYEMGTDDYATLKATANSDGSNLSGPGSAAGRPNVMCLSCHRAHASCWDSMTRWNVRATMIVENGVYPGRDNRGTPEYAQGRSEAEARSGYYDRPASRFAAFQRSLCNKCHAKD